MVYLGYIAAVLIGVLLGLIGAGGSILTIPVLVYLIGISPVNATSYSLFIIGISAFIGGLRYLKNNLICLRTVLVFGLPSVISIFFTRKYLLHAIPNHLFNIGQIEITKDGTALMAQATGQESFPLTATTKDTFAFEQGGIVLVFDTVKHEMILKQGGREFNFMKEK